MDSGVSVAIITAVGGVLTATLGSLVGLMFERQKKSNAKEEVRDAAMACILRRDLIDDHIKHTNRGYMTIHGKENWDKMHDSYKNLGGNGMIDTLNKEIQALKIKQDVESK